MAQVDETIVGILSDVPVAVQIAVVDPHVGGHVETDGIAVVGVDFADFHVADDDVGDFTDFESDALESWKGIVLALTACSCFDPRPRIIEGNLSGGRSYKTQPCR